ncbi:MAG: apolipoprotein N-acyltransferase [Desulfomonile tiedjei]|nr:apolipoprotein N-acyltransferase [Desulfomonile tiedjei]
MIKSLLAAAAGGFLLSLSFSPTNLYLLAWISFIPLFWALRRQPSFPHAAMCGFAFGAAFFLVDVSWVYRTLVLHGHFETLPALAVFFGMVLSLAFIPAVFALGLSFLARAGFRQALVAPFLWVALEYVRTVIFTGFPWDLTGYSQAGQLRLIQIADLTGVYGISFLVVFVNGALWEVLTRIPRGTPFTKGFSPQPSAWRLLEVAALIVVATLVYGQMRLKDFPAAVDDPGSCGIGVLQGNIPQEIKWEQTAREHTFRTYEKLAEQAVAHDARLLVWPETAIPVLFGRPDEESKRAGEISERVGAPMLVGAPFSKDVAGKTRYFNSAFLVDGKMLRYRYDKMHLVPFGEYMPLTWLLPLGPGLAAREEDYSPGNTMTVMHSKGCPAFSVLICYEAIFPNLARLAVRNGAGMLVNITNDGWFGATAAPYQHLVMAGLRSIENRIWLIRCANTGISTAFDPAGRKAATIALEQEGFFTVRVPSSLNPGSFYSRFGDVFAWGCIVCVAVLGLWAIIARRHKATIGDRP